MNPDPVPPALSIRTTDERTFSTTALVLEGRSSRVCWTGVGEGVGVGVEIETGVDVGTEVGVGEGVAVGVNVGVNPSATVP